MIVQKVVSRVHEVSSNITEIVFSSPAPLIVIICSCPLRTMTSSLSEVAMPLTIKAKSQLSQEAGIFFINNCSLKKILTFE